MLINQINLKEMFIHFNKFYKTNEKGVSTNYIFIFI
jgi:hypothetical protein